VKAAEFAVGGGLGPKVWDRISSVLEKQSNKAVAQEAAAKSQKTAFNRRWQARADRQELNLPGTLTASTLKSSTRVPLTPEAEAAANAVRNSTPAAREAAAQRAADSHAKWADTEQEITDYRTNWKAAAREAAAREAVAYKNTRAYKLGNWQPFWGADKIVKKVLGDKVSEWANISPPPSTIPANILRFLLLQELSKRSGADEDQQ
jgi:hypothetical protein